MHALLWITLVLTADPVPAAETRVWHATDGKKVEAAFGGVDYQRTATGETVQVRIVLPDGKEGKVPWERLSAVDQAFVLGQLLAKLGAAEVGAEAVSAPMPVANKPALPVRLTPLANRAAYKAVLAKQGTVEMVETPLQDFTAFLQQTFKVPIEIDRRALDEVGIGSDTPITISKQNAQLQQILVGALSGLDLSFHLHNGTIQISSKENIESALYTVAYPVADLLDRRMPDFDLAIDTITRTVQPDAWDEVGGPASIAAEPRSLQLIINASESMHNQLEAYFLQIRKR